MHERTLLFESAAWLWQNFSLHGVAPYHSAVSPGCYFRALQLVSVAIARDNILLDSGDTKKLVRQFKELSKKGVCTIYS